MQFVAERGIENGLQIVTPIFLNPLNCLYTKKDCKFFQSYEKSSAIQNKSHLFLLPRRRNFSNLYWKSYEKSSAMPNIFGFFKSLGTIFGIIIKVYRNPCDSVQSRKAFLNE